MTIAERIAELDQLAIEDGITINQASREALNATGTPTNLSVGERQLPSPVHIQKRISQHRTQR